MSKVLFFSRVFLFKRRRRVLIRVYSVSLSLFAEAPLSSSLLPSFHLLLLLSPSFSSHLPSNSSPVSPFLHRLLFLYFLLLFTFFYLSLFSIFPHYFLLVSISSFPSLCLLFFPSSFLFLFSHLFPSSSSLSLLSLSLFLFLSLSCLYFLSFSYLSSTGFTRNSSTIIFLKLRLGGFRLVLLM